MSHYAYIILETLIQSQLQASAEFEIIDVSFSIQEVFLLHTGQCGYIIIPSTCMGV